MKEVSRELYHGCSETMIFPFLDEDASDIDIAWSANIRVLFEDGKPPRIIGNYAIGELSVEDIQRLQSALKRATELAPATEHADALPSEGDVPVGATLDEARTPEQWQRIEADYRETVTRLHSIAIKHKLPTPPGEYVDVTIAREFDNLQAENAAARSRIGELEAALGAIANSEHCSYSNNEQNDYGKGVTDGHRLCAQIARVGLAAKQAAQ